MQSKSIFSTFSTEISAIKVFEFVLTVSGLKISYNKAGAEQELIASPSETCNLLNQLGMIEGFDFDRDDVPVILFSDTVAHYNYSGEQIGERPSTGFIFWADFVKEFKHSAYYNEKNMKMIAELHESRKLLNAFQAELSDCIGLSITIN